MKTMLMFRTECNQRSKYFTDIASAFMHFQVCMAKRKSVELWVVAVKEKQCGKRFKVLQELLDCADFN